MADPGNVEPLFISLRTTAALTSNNDDAFSQVLHHLNAILNVRAAGGTSESEMYRAAVGELLECIGRNERGMYGDSKNIAFLNFAKSFASLAENDHNLFDPLLPQCATTSEASPSSMPPRLHPVSRDIYQMLSYEREDEQEFRGFGGTSMDNLIDEGSNRRPRVPSPQYSSSPTYDLEIKQDIDSEGTQDGTRSINQHDTILSVSNLFRPAAASTPKPPPAKRQKKEPSVKADPPDDEVCPYCPYKSTCHAHVTKHVRINHPNNWVQFATVCCGQCDYRCRNTHTQRRHIKSIHGDTWLQWVNQRRINFSNHDGCPFCDTPSDDINSLCFHVTKHHLEDLRKEDPYIGCEGCEETFNFAADLYAHWTRQHSPCSGFVKLLKLKSRNEEENVKTANGYSQFD